MALEVGSRLGHYDVTALIGEGGMGQVYRATDTQLGRDVALKILPDAFAADPDRLARFQREAQVLASLNHPNIAQIHGIEKSDDTQALVLELVEGPTLADRIAKGPIPLDEALPIAKQIAEALEAAHEAGVIHRDLKPANIKVREDGTVKVLDFGLAKALDTTPAGDPSQSPTLTAAATQMGVIMGTAAYMSPEQAAGKTVDKRGDIWSFGVVLFEMLTGQRLFTGETVSHVLGGVLRVDPDWSTLPAATPEPVRRLLRRSLQKDRQRRLRDVGDTLADLDEAPTTQPTGETEQAPVTSPTGWRRALPLALGISAVAVVITGLAVWVLMRQPDTPTDLVRLVMAGPEVASGFSSDLALSPDGTQIVYRGGDSASLYVRPLDQLDAIPLRGTELLWGDPFFSPGGEWVGFAGSSLHLEKVSLFGGAPETLAQLPAVIGGASWGADDLIIVGMLGAGLFRVPGAGGEPEVLTTLDAEQGETAHARPSIIPNHQAVLFVIASGQPVRTSGQLAVLALETREVTRLGLAGTSPRYVSTGHLVYATEDSSVRAVPFDPGQLVVTGDPVTLVKRVVVKDNGAANMSISDTGRLLYMTNTGGSEVPPSLVWVDREGREEDVVTTLPGFVISWPRLSPEGSRVALGGNGVRIHDLERGTDLSLTEQEGIYPTWTEDGSKVTFISSRAGSYDLYSLPADGSGPVELLLDAPETPVPGSWLPDGQTLVYHEVNPDTQRDLWVLPEGGDPSPFLVTEFNEHAPRLSPDGQWVAYVSDQTGENRIYVQRFSEGGRVIPISTGPGTEAVWSRDGRELFYRDGNRMMSVAIELGPDLTVGRTSVVFEGSYALDIAGVGIPFYDVSLDGQQFLMVKPGETTDEIVLVQDWFSELERLVPTN